MDEADIVEAFVRHTAHYASHHIFIDNGSRDGTLEILQALKAEGFGITVFQNLSVAFNEVHFNTSMFNHAVGSHEADWVLCLDADEFIDDRGVVGGLAGLFERLKHAPDALCVRLPLIEYRRARDDPDEVVVPLRQCKRMKEPSTSKIFLSRRLAGPDLRLGGGNHWAFVRGARVTSSVQDPGLLLAHYTDRSAYSSAAKWVKGWAKVLAAGPDLVKDGANAHYRGPFRLLCDTPEVFFEDPTHFALAPLREDYLHDPIIYRGGPLRYTRTHQEAYRSLRMVLGHLEELASRYGRLVQGSAEARHIAHGWDSELRLLIGEPTLLEAPSGPIPFWTMPPDPTHPASLVSGPPVSVDEEAECVDPVGSTVANAMAGRAPIGRMRRHLAKAAERFGRWVAPRDAATYDERLAEGGVVWRVFVETVEASIAGGRHAEADRARAQATAAFPHDRALLFAHAMAAHTAGRHKAAVARWTAYRSLVPEDPMGHAGLSANLRELGDLEGAAPVVDRAVLLFPENLAVLTEAARVMQYRGIYGRALSLWERALAGPTTHPDWFQGQVFTLTALDRFGEADAVLERGQAIHPGSPALAQAAEHVRRERESAKRSELCPAS